MALANRIKCTFEDCTQTFISERELRKHKMMDGDHEYCSRCNLDFDDYDDLILHKLQSTRHIVCPICGEDFKSTGGKEAHFRQAHRAKQKVHCPACREEFSAGAALMAHIENDDCEKLTIHEYKAQRARKEVFKTALERAEADDGSTYPTESASRTVPVPGADAASAGSWDENGGMDVGDNWLDKDPVKIPETSNQAIQQAIERLKLGPDAAAEKQLEEWPALLKSVDIKRKGVDAKGRGVDINGKGKTKENGRPNDPALEDLMDFSQVSAVRPSIPNQVDTSAPQSVITTNTRRTYADDWAKIRSFGNSVTVAPGDSPIARLTGGYLLDTSKFYNPILNEYICACDKPFKTSKELEEHIGSGIHMSGLARCPMCLRIFKSVTALIAHMETATVRCRIRDSSQYAQYMEDISGGIISAKGKNGESGGGTKVEKKEVNLDEVEW